MTINYYMDSKINKQNERALVCCIRGISQKKIQFNTNIRIKERDWNKQRQEVRKTHPNYALINNSLNILKTKIEEFNLSASKEYPNINHNDFKQKLMLSIANKGANDSKDVIQALDEYIEQRKTQIQPITIKKFITLKNHLIEFYKKKKVPKDFNSIDMYFKDKLDEYFIIDKKLSVNTVHKYFKLLKTYLNSAYRRSYLTNLTFREFKSKKFKKPAKEIIVLNSVEFKKLLTHNFNNNKRLERVRDLFCFSCFAGQRYADIAKIKASDIKEGIWRLQSNKSKDDVAIPINKEAMSMITKYFNVDGTLSIPTNQKMNKYIKEACKEAGINENVSRTKQIGAKVETKYFEKHRLIGTHTARRTFVTMSHELGMKTEYIMEITGHEDYRTLIQYLRINEDKVIEDMRKAWAKIK